MIAKLAENYRHIEKTLVEELKIDGGSGTSSAPEIWQPVFQKIVPTKYNIEKNVYIIDSSNQESEKVSLAIYDEQYTPYIFNYGTIKYIPIEAVFAVVLCEDEAWRAAKDLVMCKVNEEEGEKPENDWLRKLLKLKTDMNAYVRIQQRVLDSNPDALYKDAFDKHLKECGKVDCTLENPKCDISIAKQGQTSTRPITILCRSYSNKDLDEKEEFLFDIVLEIKEGKLIKEIPEEEFTLEEWYEKLNHYALDRYEEAKSRLLKSMSSLKLEKSETDVKKKTRALKDLSVKKGTEEQTLLSLMFQLNQLLMLINNPMFFPHESYVQAFNKGIDENGK